ncbi:MAG: TIGR03557 family F420-dependent LLM class oxidoreductase [Candidatus Dormiibacterota bacterium]
MELGFFLSSEEHGPIDLIAFAQAAETAGFRSALISDHYHPWLEEQGQSPFVWSVIGALAATTNLRVTTGVTCPTVRIHPAVIAQAAATSAAMMPGRFRLGVGSGENLNEHILGNGWPPVRVRLQMLEEAVGIMRRLWEGGIVTEHTDHYTVENARLYTLPEEPPPVLVSAFGAKATEVAARIGNGFMTTKPDADATKRYRQMGGRGPAVAALKVCWASTREEALRTAYRLWRTEALPGQLAQELPIPEHFTQAAELVTKDMVGQSIACGPDPDAHANAINKYIDAGFDELYINQIGKDQVGFLRFFEREVKPRVRERVAAA